MTEVGTAEQTDRDDIGAALILGLLTFVSRYLTRGPVYFVDGPRLVKCIVDHTYVIQPPGYWLLARLGGLFHDPGSGLVLLSEIFSTLGVMVFFFLCRAFGLDRRISSVASICYGSVYFVWFAGDIQSSYASQILFAPLLVLLFLKYREAASTFRLMCCGVCFALGAGLRPSDGVFLVPLFAFLLFHFVTDWRDRISVAGFSILLCLAWIVPTQIAARNVHMVPVGVQMELARPTSVFVAGIGARSIANAIRVVLTALAAFWLLIPVIFSLRTRFQNRMLALWIIPGMLFFLLVYMADAVYLSYLTAAVILAAALSQRKRMAFGLLVACAAFNVGLFLAARPLRGTGRVNAALNFYVVKYCNYGIRHRWISTLGGDASVP